MAATGNEAVKLSQLKTLSDKIQNDVNTRLQADDIVAGSNVSLDTSSQPGKVVISAEGGGEQYITSVEPVNMKVAGGKLSFTDGSEFFEPYGGGMYAYQLAQNCLPVRTMANGDEQIAGIFLNEVQFKAVDGSPTYQEYPLLSLNPSLNYSHLWDYYKSKSGTAEDPVQSDTPLVAYNMRLFPTLPSTDNDKFTPDYGTAGQVLSSNGDRTFSWKAIDSSGGSIDPGSIGTTELANSGVTTEKIADGAVTSGKIAMHAVDTQQLAVGSVTSNILAADSVTANKIPNRAITEFKLADDCVTVNNMADSAVTTAKLANDAVTNDKLADNSVGAANLMTGSVTSEKIADGTVTVTDLNTAVTNRLVPTGGSSSTFLRGDGTWATPANTTYTAGDGLKLAGTAFSVNFVSDEDFDSYFGL